MHMHMHMCMYMCMHMHMHVQMHASNPPLAPMAENTEQKSLSKEQNRLKKALASLAGGDLDKIPGTGWLSLLHEAAAGRLQPEVQSDHVPHTAVLRKTESGVDGKEQYQLRFDAWNKGLPRPAEPQQNVPATQKPNADARSRVTHLSADECAQLKLEFVEGMRKQVECEKYSALDHAMQRIVVRAMVWITESIDPKYAAELMQRNEDGTGRERVHELNTALGFVLEYIRDGDPPFYAKLKLTDDGRLQLRADILYELMLATLRTNYETYARVTGLPYVPFRGTLKVVGNLVIIITEHGHFHAFYPKYPLASEDIAQMKHCETGRGLMQCYKIMGKEQSLTANTTTFLDLCRAPMDTRKLVVGTDDKERSLQTATEFRRYFEAQGHSSSDRPEPYEDSLYRLHRTEHGLRLLYLAGLGATEERISCFGGPSQHFTPRRLSITPAQQRAALHRFLECVGVTELNEAMLPCVEKQTFLMAVHYQDMWASGAQILAVQKKLHMSSTGEITPEIATQMKHEINVAMNVDVTAKLHSAQADLAQAERRLELLQAGSSESGLEAALAEVKMLKQAVRVADSRSRGGAYAAVVVESMRLLLTTH